MILAAALVLGAPRAHSQATPVTVTTSAVISYLHPIAFAPAPTGSKMIVSMEDGSVRIMDGTTHQTVRNLAKHLQPAYGVAWSPDGLYAATGDETARIFVESAVSGASIRQYRTHTKGIQKLSFNSTRQYLVSTGKDDQINIYDLNIAAPKEVRKILGKGANFYGASCSPTLPYTVATGILGPGGRAYDLVTGKQTGFLVTNDDQGVFDVSYNPAGTRLVTAGKCGDAVVFDAKTLKKLATLKGHKDFILYATYSPNGALIATASTDRTVKIWNANNFQKIAEIQDQNTVGSPLCFTADGKTLATVNDQGYLQFNTISPSQAAKDKPAAKATKKGRRGRRRRSG